MEYLQSREWPGNVRELENAIERAIVLCEEKALQIYHFQQGKASAKPVSVQQLTIDGSVQTIAEMEKQMILMALDEYNNNRTRAAEALGISIRTLRNKLREYREAGLEIP